MRLLNNAGRLALEVPGGAIDVALASRGQFGPDVQAVYQRWDEFRELVASEAADAEVKGLDESRLGPRWRG